MHAILARKIRTGEEENTEIFIIAIYCIRAKNSGWQYTKRILPPFVIPECNITLSSVWRYLVRYPDDLIRYEAAGLILGSYDNRTIRKHILLVWHMIGGTNLGLMEFLSTLPGYATVPELKAGEHVYSHLMVLVEQAGLVAVRSTEVIYVHGVYVFEKSRSRPKTTLNRVFHALLFFDTS